MNEQEIFNLITRNLCEIIPELNTHEFKTDDKMADLGANSVDRADVINKTMEALSLNIPRIELFGVTNMGELAKLFHTKCQSK